MSPHTSQSVGGATEMRVTHAERGRCRVGQALGETHHHQVRAQLAGAGACSGGILLGQWGNELEEDIFEVSLVHGNAERAWSYEIRQSAFVVVFIFGRFSGCGEWKEERKAEWRTARFVA